MRAVCNCFFYLDYHQKALDCVDYSTIDELAEEQPEVVTSGKHLNFAKNFQSQSMSICIRCKSFFKT